MPHFLRYHRRLACATACAWLGVVAGCSVPFSASPNAVYAPAAIVENPVFIPTGDREMLWNQLVDTVDNYFKIEREDRGVREGVVVEGRIDTYPTVGSTLLEPWRRDSTPGFEKLHATLQTVRRRAEVRVIPAQGGYLVDVAVFKELEDRRRPQHSTVGGAVTRHDSSLVRNEIAEQRQDRALAGNAPQIDLATGTLGWIPLGRDVTLEQQILAEIRQRVGFAAVPNLPATGL